MSVRQFVVAFRPLNEEIPAPAKITGVVVRPFRWPQDVEASLSTYNRAFTEHWCHREQNLRSWEAKLAEPNMRFDLSWVAEPLEAPGRIVGLSLCMAPIEQMPPCRCKEAWVDILATVPTWQGRGIGRALLMRSLRSMCDAGVDYAILGVDSECEPSVRHLYTSAGFRVPEGIGRVSCGREHCWCASAGVIVSA